MERKLQLLKNLEAAKQEIALYGDLLEKAKRMERNLQTELAATYKPAFQSTDLAAVRRNILAKMRVYPKRLWTLGELADLLPEIDYQVLGRQLQCLTKKGALLWNYERGVASRYSVKA